jgi:formylglycine-generating enzyme required for sulfatase activity
MMMRGRTRRFGSTRLWLVLTVTMLAAAGSLAWYYWPAAADPGEAVQLSDVEVTNSINMRFVRIPAGTFVMGSPDDERDRGADETAREVEIGRPFYLGAFEVTQAQYEKVAGKNPSFFAKGGGGQERVANSDTSKHPVDNVSWHDAVAFCKKLGDLPAEKAAGRTYRLPTEAEWEYACRAGTKTATHYGDQMDANQANFNGLSPYRTTTGGPFFRRTTRVGEYRPNAFGLYDMHGNVQEWCADWYAADYYARSPKADPPGPANGTERVLRGGAWPHSGKACRSAVRNKQSPETASYSFGFRVVLTAR